MNPAHTSPEPGLAPCGMKMEPVYADGPEGAPPSLPPGAVRVTPERQQLIGVRAGEVQKAPVPYTLRALGRVAAEESRVYRLAAFLDGWVQTVHPYTTGSLVLKNEILATLGSRDIINEVQIYLSTLGQLDRSPRGDRQLFVNYQVRVRRAEEALLNLGMSPAQIQELARTRRYTQEVEVQAPVTGFLLARNLSPGQRISKGEELYRLADLSRVWIVADLYDRDLSFLTPGLAARAILVGRRQEFRATVTEVPPEFDPGSRAFRVRLEADNPGYVLRPGMFVDLELPLMVPETLTVPVDAVLDSGRQQRVFVDRGNGYFEPREVQTGRRFGDRVEILRGLEPGERIVVSGNFLIDSESRMKLAAAGFAGEVTRDPVSGAPVDTAKARAAGLVSRHHHRDYFFQSEESRRQFEAHPERYGEAGAGPAAAGVLARCPVCGLEVDPVQARAQGLLSDYQGQTHYLCRPQCKGEFEATPGRYLSEAPRAPAPAGDAALRDPVCGLTTVPQEAQARRLKRTYQGREYYFCREWCAHRFDQAPERYVPARSPQPQPELTAPDLPERSPAPGPVPAAEQSSDPPAAARDPVCGMSAATTGEEVFQTLYDGRIYYFCSDRCKAQFDLDPKRYLREAEAAGPPLTPPRPAEVLPGKTETSGGPPPPAIMAPPAPPALPRAVAPPPPGNPPAGGKPSAPAPGSGCCPSSGPRSGAAPLSPPAPGMSP
jgi:RND family efflux transporter MFP subunit